MHFGSPMASVIFAPQKLGASPSITSTAYMDLLHQLQEQFHSQTLLDWTITITALVYVWLAARERVSCWVWGIVSCGLWALADFFRYNLWVDGLLQLFYVGMGVWGLYNWRRGSAEQGPLPIRRMSAEEHGWLVFLGCVLTLVLGWIFDRYTSTALPYPDSFITAFSILATVLTVKKKLESWLYWVVVDFLAIFLFYTRGALLVSVVMAVYTMMAIFGYLSWRNKFARQVEN